MTGKAINPVPEGYEVVHHVDEVASFLVNVLNAREIVKCNTARMGK